MTFALRPCLLSAAPSQWLSTKSFLGPMHSCLLWDCFCGRLWLRPFQNCSVVLLSSLFSDVRIIIVRRVPYLIPFFFILCCSHLLLLELIQEGVLDEKKCFLNLCLFTMRGKCEYRALGVGKIVWKKKVEIVARMGLVKTWWSWRSPLERLSKRKSVLEVVHSPFSGEKMIQQFLAQGDGSNSLVLFTRTKLDRSSKPLGSYEWKVVFSYKNLGTLIFKKQI